MSFSNVSDALDKHLATMADVPAVDWENVGYDQDEIIFYSQNILPIDPTPIGMEQGGTDVLAGIYQIMIHVPKNEGKAAYLAEVEKLKARFSRSQILERNGTKVILERVFSSPALPDVNFYKIPVTVKYRGI